MFRRFFIAGMVDRKSWRNPPAGDAEGFLRMREAGLGLRQSEDTQDALDETSDPAEDPTQQTLNRFQQVTENHLLLLIRARV